MTSPVAVFFNTKSLLRWAGKFAAKQKQIPFELAHALNDIGDKLVTDVAQQVAEQTEMSVDQVSRAIFVRRATPSNLSYRIDASRALIEEPATRPFGRGREFGRRTNDYFHAEEMVNVVTFGDDKVCQLCKDYAADGPYTITEARTRIPLHPHCRCLVEAVRAKRSLPVEFHKGTKSKASWMTINEMSDKMKQAVKIQLKVK